jgi:hypothetical protein
LHPTELLAGNAVHLERPIALVQGLYELRAVRIPGRFTDYQHNFFLPPRHDKSEISARLKLGADH